MSTYAITEHETISVRSASPELLDAEVHYAAGGKLPPSHLHPAQDERFEVLEGALHVEVWQTRPALATEQWWAAVEA